jgi:lipoprotein-releasing system permease protein
MAGTTVQETVQRRGSFDDVEKLTRQLAQFAGVTAVVPAIRGQAFLVHGVKRLGVSVSGADPAKQERINALQDDMIAGRWLSLGSDEIVVGFRLADEAGVRLGDRVRLISSEGVDGVFTVAGIFDTGQNAADLGSVFTTLRSAQRLFRLQGAVSSVLLKLADPFAANRVADAVTGSLRHKSESWMREQAQFVNGLRAQSSSSAMISVFALLASAFSIAAVLIVSVIQKSKEIGILKSMGARDRQIMLIFGLEGLGIAMVGAAAGCGAGYLFLRMLAGVRQVARFGRTDQLFPVSFDPAIFLGAAAAAVAATMFAAVLPARRAARMDPVEIIHGS